MLELLASMAMTGTAAAQRIVDWASENSTQLRAGSVLAFVGIVLTFLVGAL